MIRVALVDDQAMFRAGIAMVLDSQPDLDVVGQAEDGDEVPALVAEHRPDIVVMDVQMTRVDGVTATRRLVETLGDEAPKVLVLTTFDLDESAVSAIEAESERLRPQERAARAAPRRGPCGRRRHPGRRRHGDPHAARVVPGAAVHAGP